MASVSRLVVRTMASYSLSEEKKINEDREEKIRSTQLKNFTNKSEIIHIENTIYENYNKNIL